LRLRSNDTAAMMTHPHGHPRCIDCSQCVGCGCECRCSCTGHPSSRRCQLLTRMHRVPGPRSLVSLSCARGWCLCGHVACACAREHVINCMGAPLLLPPPPPRHCTPDHDLARAAGAALVRAYVPKQFGLRWWGWCCSMRA